MSVPSEPTVDVGEFESISHAVGGLGGMSEVMDQTVTQATGAVDGLKDLLRRLEALAVLSREHQRNEEKIGQLFTRVQDYIDRATAEAQEQARALIAEAEIEAARIVAAAREEAHRLISDARRPTGLPPEAVKQLQVTIEGFARLNSDLLHELAMLNQTLTDHSQEQTPPPPPNAPPAPKAWYPPPPKMQLPPPPSPEALSRRSPTHVPHSAPAPGHDRTALLFHRAS